MTICQRCGKELNDNSNFCDGCGMQINRINTVLETTNVLSDGQNSYQNTFIESKNNVASNEKTVIKKRMFSKKILIPIIAILVVLSILSASLLINNENSYNRYSFYIKDSELYIIDLNDNYETRQISSKLLADDIEDSEIIDIDDLGEIFWGYPSLVSVSADNKFVFYPEKMNDDGFALYYQEINNPDGEVFKIDSNVWRYTINESTTTVTYINGEDNLYQYNIKEDSKEKIGSNVDYFEVSDDGNKIVYNTHDGDIFLKYSDSEKEKITSKAYLYGLTGDMKTMYYKKDDTLYKQTEGEDRVKIAPNTTSVLKIYETGEIYYVTEEQQKLSAMDYVTDDAKEADAKLTEPQYPNYPNSPSWSDYDTYEEYYEAYDKYEQLCDNLYYEYEAAYENYLSKESRDELREYLKETTVDFSTFSLCFYDGTDSTVISDSYTDSYTYIDGVTNDAVVIAYKEYNLSNIEKVKLTEIEITEYYTADDVVSDAFDSSVEQCVSVGANSVVIEAEKEIVSIGINESGTDIYYLDNIMLDENGDSTNLGDLYHIAVDNGVIGKPELYESEVFNRCYFINNEKFAFYKDYNNGHGELYINKEKIDFDVHISTWDFFAMSTDAECENVFYYTNVEDAGGTLKVYQNGETKRIADDAAFSSITHDGQILYLCDYSDNYYGELYIWDNGEIVKIDDDVNYVISNSDEKYRGFPWWYF